MIMRRCLRLLALGLALSWTGPAVADPVTLDANALRQLAFMAVKAGFAADALRYTDALLARDPGDAQALILKSRAERDMGNYAAATTTGRAAWAGAESPRERYGAAMAVAQGLGSGGQKFRSQFWLRRAIEEAPDTRAQKIAVRDFRYVRNRSRLSFRLDASARPSSNVNGGTTEKIIEFYGIPLTISPDSRALSGGQVQVAVTARYRLTESDRSKTDLRLGLVERQVWLSDRAKEAAPMADARDYAFSGQEIGIDRAWKLALPGGEATLSASVGHNRYGGADMSEYGRLDFGIGRSFKGGYSGRVALSAERQHRLDDPERSATVTAATLGVMRRMANGDRLSFDLQARSTRSDAATIDHDALSVNIGWQMAKPVMGTTLALGLEVEARDYDLSALSASGRQDLSVQGNLSLTFDKLDYMGFAPVLTVEADHTSSNVVLNKSRSFGLGLGIVSKF